MEGRPWSRRQPAERKFQPRIGRDFEIDEAFAINAPTWDFLARVIALCSGTAIAGTGTYGLVTGRFGPLEVVWAISGPMRGALVTHYFGLPGRVHL